jgi:hypothetical protein
MRGASGSLSISSDLDVRNSFYKEKTLCLGGHEIFGLPALNAWIRVFLRENRRGHHARQSFNSLLFLNG